MNTRTVSALSNLRDFRNILNKVFIEREGEVNQLVYALLSRSHCFWRGKPGLAKTALPRAAFGMITGAEIFTIQLTKYMSEDHLFGPISIQKMRTKDTLEHNTKGSIVEANFAVLDEFFDANDATRRSLLAILNEREFIRGAQHVKCPLHTAVLTSNFCEDNDAMAAVLDRVLLKAESKRIQQLGGRIQMYTNALKGKKEKPGVIDYSDIEILAEAVSEVKIPMSVLESYDSVLQEFERQSNREISDRRAVQTLKLIQIRALLDGRGEATENDVAGAEKSLCVLNSPEDAKSFAMAMTVSMGNKKKLEEESEALDLVKAELERCATVLSSGKPKEIVESLRNIVGGLASRDRAVVPKAEHEEAFKRYLERAREMLSEAENPIPEIMSKQEVEARFISMSGKRGK